MPTTSTTSQPKELGSSYWPKIKIEERKSSFHFAIEWEGLEFGILYAIIYHFNKWNNAGEEAYIQLNEILIQLWQRLINYGLNWGFLTNSINKNKVDEKNTKKMLKR